MRIWCIFVDNFLVYLVFETVEVQALVAALKNSSASERKGILLQIAEWMLRSNPEEAQNSAYKAEYIARKQKPNYDLAGSYYFKRPETNLLTSIT